MTDSDWQEYLKEVINVDEYLNNTEEIDYKYELVSIKVGNSIINNFMILEIPKEKYKELEVKSKDKNTGVNIVSKRLDVPIDVKIHVKDLKNNEEISKVGKDKNIKFDQVFDIDLKRRYDNSFVKDTPFGVEVYIPVSEYKENDKVNIYYIKDNEIQDEKIEGNVITVDGRLYAKFVAKHFSTYAIGEEITEYKTNQNMINDNKKEENPKTLDGIGSSIILEIISLIGLVGTSVYLKRRNKIRA